jgi:hypothetical protein
MSKHARQRPSVSTRTAEFTPRELPLTHTPRAPHPPRFTGKQRPSWIREALRRWFDQEM